MPINFYVLDVSDNECSEKIYVACALRPKRSDIQRLLSGHSCTGYSDNFDFAVFGKDVDKRKGGKCHDYYVSIDRRGPVTEDALKLFERLSGEKVIKLKQ